MQTSKATEDSSPMAQVLAKQIASIGYDNFKHTVTEPRYHASCMGVWSVMNDLQRGRDTRYWERQ